MNKVKFSIIGCGYFIKVFCKGHPLYEKLKSEDRITIGNYITDSGLWKTLELKNECGNLYSSFHEINPSQTFTAYAIDDFTRLEIKGVKQKSIKLFFKNLLVNYLFPPSFKVNQNHFESEGLVVIEIDKGFFGRTVELKKFDVDDIMAFNIVTIPGLNVKAVNAIRLNDDEITFKQSDTLNFGMYSCLV